MAPAAGKPVPGLGLAVAEPELGLPCRVRGDNVTRARGHFHLPVHLCAGVAPSPALPAVGRICGAGGQCWCLWP